MLIKPAVFLLPLVYALPLIMLICPVPTGSDHIALFSAQAMAALLHIDIVIIFNNQSVNVWGRSVKMGMAIAVSILDHHSMDSVISRLTFSVSSCAVVSTRDER